MSGVDHVNHYDIDPNRPSRTNKVYKIKCVLIGDQGVGKSTLSYFYVHDELPGGVSTTIGACFLAKNVPLIIDGNAYNVKIQLWDTAGSEKFRALMPHYYRGALLALIMFDLTNPVSLEHVDKWIHDLYQHVGISDTKPLIILVGTKADLIEKRIIHESDIEAKAKQHQCKYYVTSCLNSDAHDHICNMFNKTLIELHDRLCNVNDDDDVKHNKTVKLDANHVNNGFFGYKKFPSCCK